MLPFILCRAPTTNSAPLLSTSTPLATRTVTHRRHLGTVRSAELHSAFQETFVRWLTATKNKLRNKPNKALAAPHLIEPAVADKELGALLTEQVAELLGAVCAVL